MRNRLIMDKIQKRIVGAVAAEEELKDAIILTKAFGHKTLELSLIHICTSTTYAPWIVVEGNSKYYARVKILSAVADALETRIKSCN